MSYALIQRDLSVIMEERLKLNPVPKDTGSGPYWVPIHYLVDSQQTEEPSVLDPEVETIYANRVERVRVRRNMTPVELDAHDDEVTQKILDDKTIHRAIGQILYQLINEVRTLKSQPTITPAQFKTYVKGLIRS